MWRAVEEELKAEILIGHTQPRSSAVLNRMDAIELKAERKRTLTKLEWGSTDEFPARTDDGTLA